MNFLVDTCVLSELAKRKPDANVVRWMKRNCTTGQFFVSAVTIGEIMEGIESLPLGDRNRQKLAKWFKTSILDVYEDSVIAFDKDVALKWGEIKGRTNQMGKVRPDLDAQIAATALVHGMTVLTRNVADMEHTGVKTINPFDVRA